MNIIHLSMESHAGLYANLSDTTSGIDIKKIDLNDYGNQQDIPKKHGRGRRPGSLGMKNRKPKKNTDPVILPKLKRGRPAGSLGVKNRKRYKLPPPQKLNSGRAAREEEIRILNRENIFFQIK